MGKNLRGRLAALTAVFLALAACGPQGGGPGAQPEAAGQDAGPAATESTVVVSPAPPAPSWKDAANLHYSGVLDGPLQLKEGRWEGAPYAEGGASAPRAGLAEDFILTGDLDGDAGAEAVVLLWSSAGGSGTFDYLAVLDRDAAGTVIHRATAPLGDRVKVRSARIADGQVVIETVQAGPQDAACCPGQKMKRIFALEDDAMEEKSTEDQGRLSLADLAGKWKLVQFHDDEAPPEDVQITAQFEGSQISGRAACNRYTGNVEEGGAPGELMLSGALAVTRMMCLPPLMEWEQRYLAALQGLTNYTFRAGRLVLTWRVEEAMGTLVFEPAAPG